MNKIANDQYDRKGVIIFSNFAKFLLGLMQIVRLDALPDSMHSSYTKPPAIDPIAMAEQGGFTPELLDRNVFHTDRADKLRFLFRKLRNEDPIVIVAFVRISGGSVPRGHSRT